jgi:hypothetical protein
MRSPPILETASLARLHRPRPQARVPLPTPRLCLHRSQAIARPATPTPSLRNPQSGNLLVLQQPGFDPASPDVEGPLTVIDFEYGSYTYRWAFGP